MDVVWNRLNMFERQRATWASSNHCFKNAAQKKTGLFGRASNIKPYKSPLPNELRRGHDCHSWRPRRSALRSLGPWLGTAAAYEDPHGWGSRWCEDASGTIPPRGNCISSPHPKCLEQEIKPKALASKGSREVEEERTMETTNIDTAWYRFRSTLNMCQHVIFVQVDQVFWWSTCVCGAKGHPYCLERGIYTVTQETPSTTSSHGWWMYAIKSCTIPHAWICQTIGEHWWTPCAQPVEIMG